MSTPFRFSASADHLKGDALLASQGFSFRKGFLVYCKTARVLALSGGDKVRVLFDQQSGAIAFRRVESSVPENGFLVSISPAGGVPHINSHKLASFLMDALGGPGQYQYEFSLTGFCVSGTGDFVFEPTETVKTRLRALLDQVPSIAEAAGFRRHGNEFIGDEHTISFANGALVAMRRGHEAGNLHVCVPYMSAVRIQKWLSRFPRAID